MKTNNGVIPGCKAFGMPNILKFISLLTLFKQVNAMHICVVLYESPKIN